MSEMSVKDMVIECLDCHGFDGLYDEAGCGCMLADLAPCNEMSQHCEAAYLFACSRCAKRPTCDLADEEQPWLMAPNKDHCTPDYATAAPAATCAAQNAALPACASMTVGEVLGIKFLSGDDLHGSALVEKVCSDPDWHARCGIGEAPEGALKAEPGEVFIPIADVAEVIEKAINDSAPKPMPAALAMPLPAKEVCQNTAKTESASRMLIEDRTAEYMRFLGFDE